MSKTKDAMDLLKQAMKAISESDQHAANDDIDEESLREWARDMAAQMKRARSR